MIHHQDENRRRGGSKNGWQYGTWQKHPELIRFFKSSARPQAQNVVGSKIFQMHFSISQSELPKAALHNNLQNGIGTHRRISILQHCLVG
jgi:hypothetical protein